MLFFCLVFAAIVDDFVFVSLLLLLLFVFLLRFIFLLYRRCGCCC